MYLWTWFIAGEFSLCHYYESLYFSSLLKFFFFFFLWYKFNVVKMKKFINIFALSLSLSLFTTMCINNRKTFHALHTGIENVIFYVSYKFILYSAFFRSVPPSESLNYWKLYLSIVEFRVILDYQRYCSWLDDIWVNLKY